MSLFELYLRLGFKHIVDLNGYDHIVFILALYCYVLHFCPAHLKAKSILPMMLILKPKQMFSSALMYNFHNSHHVRKAGTR